MPVLREEFCALLRKLRVPLQGNVGVALSGGADSMALCYLLALTLGPRRVYAFTVDHRLRENSTEEALYVAECARRIGVQHQLLTIKWPDQRLPSPALLETLARQERYALLARACRDHQIRWLFVGHHADDQQETAIFRLARASGIYGLAGLAPVASWPFPYALEAASIDASLMTPNGPHTIRQTALGLLRPLLTIPKYRLKATCREAGITWVEDPSNRSSVHQRNVIRMTLEQLRQHAKPSGSGKDTTTSESTSAPLSFKQLQDYCERMLAHRSIIDQRARVALNKHTKFDASTGIAYLILHPDTTESTDFFQIPRPVRHRVLTILYQTVRAAQHPPRLEHLKQMDTILRTPISSSVIKPVVSAGLYLAPTTQTSDITGSIWCIARQPLTHQEQTQCRIILAEWSKKHQTYIAINEATIHSSHFSATPGSLTHVRILWDHRILILASWSSTTSPSTSLDPIKRYLIIRSFHPKHDITHLRTYMDAIRPWSIQQYTAWQHFCQFPVALRSTLPVIALTDDPTHSTDQIVALPSFGLCFVPWLHNAVAHHIAHSHYMQQLNDTT